MKKRIILSFTIMMMLFTVSCGSTEDIEDVQEETTTGDEVLAIIEEQMAAEAEEEAKILEEQEQEASEAMTSTEGVDIDLTTLSATMVYAEVYNMYAYTDEYIGKIIKMEGTFYYYEDPDSGNIYFAVLVQDALACCSQGIEFVLEGDYVYPDDYPEYGEELTIIGEFDQYEEDGTIYCHIKNASFV